MNDLSDPGDGTCDDTECTLREAITFASSGAAITFTPGLTGTITLANGEYVLSKSLSIAGPSGGTITITGHSASRVFYMGAVNVTLSNLTITGGNGAGTSATNVSPGEAGWGGGILVDGGGLTLRNSTVSGNSSGSYRGGGGIAKLYGSLTVENSTISGNAGSWYGGGIYAYGTGLVIRNSTISGNSVPGGMGAGGGGVWTRGVNYILYTTITGNSGGGIQTYNNTGYTKTNIDTRMKGSIISGNSNSDLRTTYTGETYPVLWTSLGYNLVGSTTGVDYSGVFLESDQTGVTTPGLNALADNGGPTRTHELQATSAALDAIPSGDCTDNTGTAVTKDQRGIDRPQGGSCDIGAFEKVTALTTPTFVFSLATLPAKTFGDDSFSVTSYASTNSTGAITYALGTGSVGCSVASDGTVTITGAAVDANSCIIEASLASDGTYSAAGPLSSSFHIAKAAGSVTISNLPASGAIGGSFTPAYTKSGDGTASTASNSPSVCTVTSGVVDFIAAGSCVLQASVTAGTDYLAATGTEQSFSIALGAPTFAFDLSTLPAKTFGDESFSVASYATTNSTGAITFGLGAGSVGCSVASDGTVTITGAAVASNYCIVEASVAADDTYSGAGPISQSFHIAKAAGSVTINNIPSSASLGGSFTPTYTKSGNGTASTVSNTTGVCTVTSGVVDFIATGSCELVASVTEGTNHLAATGTPQSFTISLVTPTFTFDLSTLPAKTFGDGTFNAADYASTSSTGAITFALGSNSMGCAVTPTGTVTISGAALDPNHCIIEATLAADGDYAGAGPISQSVNIAKAAGSVSIDNMPESGIVGGSFSPTFSTVGDGTASVASLTPAICTVADGNVTYVAAGDCSLQASITAGTNHLAATGIEQHVTITALPLVFSSACTYTIHPKNGQRTVTVTWENASPGVTKVEVSNGKVITKQYNPSATGYWSTIVKTGTPTYGLWGGTSRKDSGTTLVTGGSCTLQ